MADGTLYCIHLQGREEAIVSRLASTLDPNASSGDGDAANIARTKLAILSFGKTPLRKFFSWSKRRVDGTSPQTKLDLELSGLVSVASAIGRLHPLSFLKAAGGGPFVVKNQKMISSFLYRLQAARRNDCRAGKV